MTPIGRCVVFAGLLVLHACAQMPLPIGRAGPVTTFTFEAQAQLEQCAALAGLLGPAPVAAASPLANAVKGQRVDQCVASAKDAVEDKYRTALDAVHLQRGTFSALKAYYDEWEETLDQMLPSASYAVGPPDHARLLREIEQLRSKADSLHGR